MPEFKVGDRVICVEDNPYGNDDIFAGNTGTVCREDDYGDVGICWDDKVEGGHNCDGSCEYGFGWYVSPSAIKLDTEADEPFEFDETEFNKLVFYTGQKTMPKQVATKIISNARFTASTPRTLT